MHDDLGTLDGAMSAIRQGPAAPGDRSAQSWTITLDYPRPPKGLSANDRPRHWSVKAGATADIRLEVFAKVRALHLGVLDRISVQVVWIVKDKIRRDTDNLAPFCKAIFDGIGADKGVSAHLVDDDDPAHMLKPGAVIQYVKGARPRFEVTITNLAPVVLDGRLQ